jgi:uncharacterized protein (DUF736 family)
MAKQFDDELHGVLFVNDRKTTDNQPDYSGKCQVDGQEYRISGWKRDSQTGKKFLSLSLTADQGQGQKAPAKEAAKSDIDF